MVSEQAHRDRDPDVAEQAVDSRALLLPEERAAGSDDARAQAAAILAESDERTEHPDPDASSQAGRRTSAQAS